MFEHTLKWWFLLKNNKYGTYVLLIDISNDFLFQKLHFQTQDALQAHISKSLLCKLHI